MFESFLILSRESFEVILVIGIMLAYLKKTKNNIYNKYVYLGAFAGIGLSILGAYLFDSLADGFKGQAEELFEGATMLIASALVTSMILWVARQRHISMDIAKKMQANINKKYAIGIVLFSLFAVLREGIEIVLFINAASYSTDGSISLIGATLGIICSLLLGYLFFKTAIRLNLSTFFKVTGIMLVIISAGFVAKGLHEFQEAGVLPILEGQAWDTKQFLDSKTGFGLLFSAFVGYSDHPTQLMVASYLGYLVLVYWLWGCESQKKFPRKGVLDRA